MADNTLKMAEWLDKQWRLNESLQACKSSFQQRNSFERYYDGATMAIQILGYSWQRDSDGHHTVGK